MTILTSETFAEIERLKNLRANHILLGPDETDWLLSAISEALSRARSVPEGETPKELPPSKDAFEAVERLLSISGISIEAGWSFLNQNLPRKLDEVYELMQELFAKPSHIPSGELGELLKEVERVERSPLTSTMAIEWRGITRRLARELSSAEGRISAIANESIANQLALSRELSTLRDSCEAQRVEIEDLKIALEVEIAERDYLRSQLGPEFR